MASTGADSAPLSSSSTFVSASEGEEDEQTLLIRRLLREEMQAFRETLLKEMTYQSEQIQQELYDELSGELSAENETNHEDLRREMEQEMQARARFAEREKAIDSRIAEEDKLATALGEQYKALTKRLRGSNARKARLVQEKAELLANAPPSTAQAS